MYLTQVFVQTNTKTEYPGLSSDTVCGISIQWTISFLCDFDAYIYIYSFRVIRVDWCLRCAPRLMRPYSIELILDILFVRENPDLILSGICNEWMTLKPLLRAPGRGRGGTWRIKYGMCSVHQCPWARIIFKSKLSPESSSVSAEVDVEQIQLVVSSPGLKLNTKPYSHKCVYINLARTQRELVV